MNQNSLKIKIQDLCIKLVEHLSEASNDYYIDFILQASSRIIEASANCFQVLSL